MSEWILVSESMPEEHPTAVSKLAAGGKHAGFPQKMSDRVIATIVFPDGGRMTASAWTVDGEWRYDYAMPFEVVAWMEMPEPYEEDD